MTFEEFQRKLHCSHTSSDEVERRLYEAEQVSAAAIEYSKLRLEQARQKKARMRDGRDMRASTKGIGTKCGAALNKIHRLVQKLGE